MHPAPYGCSLGLLPTSVVCMETPNLVIMLDLYSYANSYDRRDLIDSTNNIKGDKVYVYHGSADTVVRPG